MKKKYTTKKSSPKMTRMFNGDRFSYLDAFVQKPKAQELQINERNKGNRTRLVKSYGYWVVYRR